ncbi:MAG TPA: zinc ribbon domain-containing protein [Elusimicrobiales bacterium]|nr:zinc ribbon domain-containing protein [Elusimicrobiales bacterium]
MEEPSGLPENIKCPYCGADNAADSEFCGACYKNLHIPGEVRAAAKIKKLLSPAPPPAAAAEAPSQRPALRLWARLAVLAGLAVFYTQWYKHKNYFSPLDYVNLAFHEAGHVLLGFLPEFIVVLAGTLFQLLMPAVCLAHLMRRGANLGWQLCLFWLGESLLNISIYAGDALKQELPLVGGGGHDWTYLLTETGLITHPQGVERAIFLAGSAVIFWSFYLIGKDALNRESIELGDSL